MFHASLAQALCAQALAVHEQTGVTRIGLGGGVFQNRVLADLAQSLLSAAGFEVLKLRRIDVMNDVAFMVTDLVAHGRQDLTFSFLNAYLEHPGPMGQAGGVWPLEHAAGAH